MMMRRWANTIAAALLLGGVACSNSPSIPLASPEAIAAARLHSVKRAHLAFSGWLSPKFKDAVAHGGVVYVGGLGPIDILSQSDPSQLLGQIVIGAWANTLAVDANGYLYVGSVSGELTKTLVIEPSKRSLIAELPDWFGGVTAIVVESNGRVYAAGEGGIAEFAPGTTSPDITIPTSFQGLGYAAGLALDREDHLFADLLTTGVTTEIREYGPAATIGRNLGITSLTWAGSLAFDAQDRLIVDVPLGHQVPSGFLSGEIDVFNVGAINPVKRYRHFIEPGSFALDRSRTHLWVVDDKANTVSELAYPSGKVLATRQFPSSFGVAGLAVSPAAQP